jgi:hypothetical protein
MELAQGIAGDKPFAVIDTEAGRAKHYADQFKFDHGELLPPFRPMRYLEAIKAADEAGYPVIVVDSASHEHAGEGGLLDYHDEELTRMAGDDWKKRERVKMAAWIKPKTEHKKFVQSLLQVRAHLILCFRAEEKVEMAKDQSGRTQIVPKQSPVGLNGWIPICEKNLPFEMTASFLLTADQPGVPRPIKLQEQHKFAFPPNQKVSRSAGAALAQWAKGAQSSPQAELPGQGNSGAGKPSDRQETLPETEDAGPKFVIQGKELKTFDSIDAWHAGWMGIIDAVKADSLPAILERNKPHLEALYAIDQYQPKVVAVEAEIENKIERGDAE